MEVSPAQLINPAIFDFDDKRRKEIASFKEAVDRAQFLDHNQRRRWRTMAYLLSNVQLEEAQDLILAENLHRLRAQQKLEKLKSKEN